MSSYRTIFSLENLYLEGSPVLLQKGVLFKNTETGQSHIQIKFRNLCDKQITALKVSIFLSSNTMSDCGCIEKQYVDVNATKNKTFGDNIPIFLDNTVASKFFAEIKEVHLINGETWFPTTESKWQIMPAEKSIGKAFPSEEAVEEFKRTYCKAAIVEPYEYKDVWVCACGNVNKNSETRCLSCGAVCEKMFPIDSDTLHKNGIYRKATELSNEKNSKAIEQAINLFNKIIDWRDSKEKVEKLKSVLSDIKKEEVNKINRKKRITVSAIAAIAAVAVVVVVIVSIIFINASNKEHTYQLAKEQISNNEFFNALETLSKIEGYKDVDDLYWYAEKMGKGDYASIIEKNKLSEFTIPDGATSIGESAFKNCSGLTSVTIPDSVTSIGSYAFYGCSGLTRITLPFIGETLDGTGYTHFGYIFGAYSFYDNDNYVPSSLKTVVISNGSGVTSIGSYAFYGCSGLTSVTIGNSVTSIDDSAFCCCRGLTSVIIDNSVTSIGSFAFFNCSGLTRITYTGTKYSWWEINKEGYWNDYTGNYTIYCTDGTIEK